MVDRIGLVLHVIYGGLGDASGDSVRIDGMRNLDGSNHGALTSGLIGREAPRESIMYDFHPGLSSQGTHGEDWCRHRFVE